jgi:hypothetical protein
MKWLLGAILLAACPMSASAEPENYMVVEGPPDYVFVDQNSIRNEGGGYKRANVTWVLEGAAVARAGHKYAVLDMSFSCGRQMAAINQRATYSADGQQQTVTSLDSHAQLRRPQPGSIISSLIGFVCAPEPLAPDYYGESPVDAADGLYDLLRPEQDPFSKSGPAKPHGRKRR